MSNLLKFAKAHKIWTALIVIVVVAVGWYWYAKAHSGATSVQYVTTPVAQDTITSSVTGSGQVSGQNTVNLTPLASGALTEIDVKQGEQVQAGQTIAVVDQSSAQTSLAQAEASLASAKANYDQVESGATPTALAQSQLGITAAQQSLSQAQANYTQVVAQQKLNVANALSSELNAGLQAVAAGTNTSSASVTVSGTYTGTQTGQYVIGVTASGNGPEYSLSGIEFSPPTNVVTRGVPQAIGKDGLFVTFSANGTLVAGDTWTISVPNTASGAYLNAANAYQSALEAQTTALASAQNQIDNAQVSLQQAQASYANTSAPPTDAQVESAQASVTQAEASVQSAQLALQNTVITAPFAGEVAQLDYTQTGVQVGPSDTIAVLSTPQQIATISLNEVDISKVALGDKVTMTFDAIDGLTMTGTVGEIDNIGTTTQGVVNYNVQVVFDVPSDQVKSGMSVNASIITSVAPDAIVVPNSAVKTGTGANAGTSYVQVLGSNGQPQNVTVQTGIVNDTMTQITSGLTVGQNVVTQTVTVKAAASTAKTTSLLPTLGGGAGGARAGGYTGGAAGGTRGGG